MRGWTAAAVIAGCALAGCMIGGPGAGGSGNGSGEASGPMSQGTLVETRRYVGLPPELLLDAGELEGDASAADTAGAEPDHARDADADADKADEAVERLLARFALSAASECECLWSAPGYAFRSRAACLLHSALDDAQRACARELLAGVDEAVLSCKLDAEDALRACLGRSCDMQADALECVATWGSDDRACDPALAGALYSSCLGRGGAMAAK